MSSSRVSLSIAARAVATGASAAAQRARLELDTAIAANDAQLVLALLERRPKLALQLEGGAFGLAPLDLALLLGRGAVVAALLERGAPYSARLLSDSEALARHLDATERALVARLSEQRTDATDLHLNLIQQTRSYLNRLAPLEPPHDIQCRVVARNALRVSFSLDQSLDCAAASPGVQNGDPRTVRSPTADRSGGIALAYQIECSPNEQFLSPLRVVCKQINLQARQEHIDESFEELQTPGRYYVRVSLLGLRGWGRAGAPKIRYVQLSHWRDFRAASARSLHSDSSHSLRSLTRSVSRSADETSRSADETLVEDPVRLSQEDQFRIANECEQCLAALSAELTRAALCVERRSTRPSFPLAAARSLSFIGIGGDSQDSGFGADGSPVASGASKRSHSPARSPLKAKHSWLECSGALRFTKSFKEGVFLCFLVYSDSKIATASDDLLPVVQLMELPRAQLHLNLYAEISVAQRLISDPMIVRSLLRNVGRGWQIQKSLELRFRLLAAIVEMCQSLAGSERSDDGAASPETRWPELLFYERIFEDADCAMLTCCVNCSSIGSSDREIALPSGLRWTQQDRVARRRAAVSATAAAASTPVSPLRPRAISNGASGMAKHQSLESPKTPRQWAQSAFFRGHTVEGNGSQLELPAMRTSPTAGAAFDCYSKLLARLEAVVHFCRSIPSAARPPLSAGLYVSYLQARSTMDALRVLVPRLQPHAMPVERVRESAHVTAEEWQTLHDLYELVDGRPNASDDSASPTSGSERESGSSPDARNAVESPELAFGAGRRPPEDVLGKVTADGATPHDAHSSPSARLQRKRVSFRYRRYIARKFIADISRAINRLRRNLTGLAGASGDPEGDAKNVAPLFLYLNEVIELSPQVALVLLLPAPEWLCTLESDSPHASVDEVSVHSLFESESFAENLLSSIEWCCGRHQLPACTTRAVALVAACDTAAAALQQVLRGLVGADEVSAVRRAVDAVQRLRERSERAWSPRRWLGDLLVNARTRSAQHALRLLNVSIFAPNGLVQPDDECALGGGLAGGSRSPSRALLLAAATSQPATPLVNNKPRRPELKRSGSVSQSRSDEADDEKHVARPPAEHSDRLHVRHPAAAAYLYPSEDAAPIEALHRLVLLTESTRSTSTNSSGRSPWSHSQSSAGSSSPPASAHAVTRPAHLHVSHPQPAEPDAYGFAHVGQVQNPSLHAAEPSPDVVIAYQFPPTPNARPAAPFQFATLNKPNNQRMKRQTSCGPHEPPVSAPHQNHSAAATPSLVVQGDSDWMPSAQNLQPATFTNGAFDASPVVANGWPPQSRISEPNGAQVAYPYHNSGQFASPNAHWMEQMNGMQAPVVQRSMGSVQFPPPPPAETLRVLTVFPAYATGLEALVATPGGADDSQLRLYSVSISRRAAQLDLVSLGVTIALEAGATAGALVEQVVRVFTEEALLRQASSSPHYSAREAARDFCLALVLPAAGERVLADDFRVHELRPPWDRARLLVRRKRDPLVSLEFTRETVV